MFDGSTGSQLSYSKQLVKNVDVAVKPPMIKDMIKVIFETNTALIDQHFEKQR